MMLKPLQFVTALVLLIALCLPARAQVSYGASLAYGLHKLIPAYSGNAIQVRRNCDNAITDIGFTPCGELDTSALKAFAGLQNFPLTSLNQPVTAAYGLRKLNCAYSGFAINVRSSAAGSPTLNVGFTINGDLDTASLKSFVGSNSAYIATWYDQSGNGRHVTQATAGSQPQIVNAGLIARQNNRPAVSFNGSSSLSLNTAVMSDKITASVVAKLNNAGTRNALFDLGNVSGSYADFVIEANTYLTAGNKWGFYSNNNSLDGTVATSTGLTLLSAVALNTFTSTANVIANTSLYVNGALSALSCRSCVTNVYRSSWPNGMVIGNFNGYPAATNGYISELIVFSTNLTAADRQFLEWTQAQYYSVTTGVALGTLPAGTLPAAYISTWYDQSGNARHISQATAASQPAIVLSGFITRQGGLPAATFNGSTQFLSASDAGLPLGDLSISAIVRSNTASPYSGFLHYGAAGNGNAVFGTYGTDGNFGTNALGISQYGDAVGIQNSTGANLIYTAGRSSTNYFTFKNGGTPVYKTMGTNTTLYGAGGLCVGNFNASLGGGYLNGTLTELCLYPFAFSATQRILFETNRAAYSGIGVANNKYTLPAAASYNYYVNGVGRESATDSVGGTKSTVGMGFIVGQAASDYLKDNGDYLTAGTNCPIVTATSTLNIPAGIVQRWYNDWYLNKTDAGANNGTATFFFDFSDYGLGGLPGVASNYELLMRPSPSSVFSVVPGTTRLVVGDRVQFSVDVSNTPTNYYYTIGTKDPLASPLPVELLSFDAACKGGEVALSWSTATEAQSDRFLVERSPDGMSFTGIGTVKAAGNSLVKISYAFADHQPLPGTAYYRLKETALDGTEKIYKQVAVACDVRAGDVRIYPNPSGGQFVLEGAELHSTFTVLNALGVEVLKGEVLLPRQDVDAGTLSDGVYMVNLVGRGGQVARKLVVQR